MKRWKPIVATALLVSAATSLQAQAQKPAATTKPAAATNKAAPATGGKAKTTFNPRATVSAAKLKAPAAAPAPPDTTDQVVKKVAELPLVLKGHSTDGQYVLIDYTTPYTGIVEIRLYDGKKKQVYQDQFVNGIGENRIRMKSTAFKPGQTYTYQLTYKGRETLGRISM